MLVLFFQRLKENLTRPRKTWEKNLLVLWFGTFMAGMGFSLVMPFMSLYIDTLGDFSPHALNLWSGLAFSATFLVTTIISPWWGRLADQKGRKIMLLRASLGMAIVLASMGLVTNVYQLVGLRLLQGVFSGYISNATALVATGTPKERSGQVLGTLATGSVTGQLLGPLVGGIIASAFGYRLTFFITGSILFLVFLLSLIFVHEEFTPIKKTDLQPASKILKELEYPHLVIGMFITTMIIQASNNSISPIISLYIRELLHGQGNVTLISGIIASLPGVATLIAAPRMGRLGDRIGSERILAVGLLLAIFVYIPMAFVTHVWQLGILRFFIGVSDACLLPAVNALITKYSPHHAAGRIFSYNQSFQATGNVFGPMIGSSVSSFFGYRAVFLSTSLLVLANFLLVRKNTAEIKTEKQ
ncbi:major facilitator superfamily transporter [Enterococcus asini ATCC 700915]|uniref:Major facilitator superfamily transporter n=1 Tax=Enterococcus asini ATCC 700915 TaxID=1158606 RepID=R2Q503_9ENTE|nr:multidrug efflux MFS transporter [Enterococcus asini]EOH90373.1 major facilitator superfamily transporter [Enterococcus asini ATCC 700915]EOT56995.1 major facilitator superfamily transporter [Enterococcus asini ATCC 700915]MDT2743668.1 multidrug efflux MFS transporter [Enterococcus asini]